jgi:membrane-associated protease RseP (regulator of RpoE activity)
VDSAEFVLTLLTGLLSLTLVGMAVVAASIRAFKLTSRWLHIEDFEVFGMPHGGMSVWRQWLARLAAVLAPLVIVCSMAFVAILTTGNDHPTNRVSVLADGPAEKAGLLDGDRIVAVDGRSVGEWDAVRAALAGREGSSVRLIIKRGDDIIQLAVQPGERGIIGVQPIPERHPATAGGAFAYAVRLPVTLIGAVFATAFSNETVEKVGLVGTARETGRPRPFGDRIFLFAFLGAYAWPIFVIVHLVDGLSVVLFRRLLRRNDGGGALAPLGAEQSRMLRVARLRQLLQVTLIGWLLLYAVLIVGVGGRAASLLVLVQIWVAPLLAVLNWSLASAIWTRWRAALYTAAVLIPCGNVLAAGHLLYSARARLPRRMRG